MARKNSQKTDTSGAIVFDSRTKAVMAQVGQDNVKEKVQAVKEVVPGRSNNEMYLVLQYHDYSVERTIQAYLEDGAKEALKEWHFSEIKVSKHKKKKSKKAADQLKSNSQPQADNNTNARLTNGIVNGGPHPTPQNSEMSKTKPRQKPSSKPPKPAKPTKGLEKSSKDLFRQTMALDRLHLVLTEEVDKAYKRIKTVFENMQTCLQEREIQIGKEMDLVKIDAMDILKSRQEKAVELREEIDGAASMSEDEIGDLRLQIKQFVSDRRIDDDLGRTTRFIYDSDRLAAEMKSFGEVIAVKCAYSSSSRPSTSTSVSLSSISVSVSSSSQDILPPPIPAQVLSESANISMQSNDTTPPVISSEGATSTTIPNSDQETSQEHTEIAEPVQKENSSPSPAKPENDDDLFKDTNYRLLSSEETQAYTARMRRRPGRRNYQNTGNREYSSRRGSNQRGGRGGGGRGGGGGFRGRGRGSGGGEGGGGDYNNSISPQERIQYLGRGARRASRPYRGGGGDRGRGEMRGSYSARPPPPTTTTTQTVTTTNK